MQRIIKSYVLRAGRISSRQQNALDHWLEHYKLPALGTPWDLTKSFGRSAETIVEIGFGMGASLVSMAKENPDINYIGIEVHQAGIGSLAADLHDFNLTNVRIAPYDAVDIMTTCIPDHSLTGIQIFFPDPWPKKRHHKRRLIQTNFVKLLIRKLKPNGFIHCATDWEDYALQMYDVLSAEPGLVNQQQEGRFSERPPTRPLTKFEKRGQQLGHAVWDLVYLNKTHNEST